MSADRMTHTESGTAEVGTPERRSTGMLLTDMVNQISNLFRKELQLFRAEVGEKANAASAAVGMIVTGGILLLVALNALMTALIALLVALGLAAGWASLTAGAAVAIIGYALISSGRKSLKGSSLAPHRTVESLQRDARTAKEAAR